MIYTLTLNPAIDYYITVDDLKSGEVNRTQTEEICFGGKGINVSLVLNEFCVKSVCMGFIGGFTGDALENYLVQKGVDCDFVNVAGNTRINVKLNDTDINAAGPNISCDDLKTLYKRLADLKCGDFLVLSGSVPGSMPQDVYQNILELLKDKGVNFVVDAEKDLLLNTLKYKPFLIKPNHHELGDIFNIDSSNFEQAIVCAKELQEQGARNVMVSFGDMGAVLLDENGNIHTQKAPKGDVISAVGAGDSMVAAFLAEYLNGKDYKECLKSAVATGSATAFSDGLATNEKIRELIKE